MEYQPSHSRVLGRACRVLARQRILAVDPVEVIVPVVIAALVRRDDGAASTEPLALGTGELTEVSGAGARKRRSRDHNSAKDR